jgi:hypothetical protein
MKKSKKRPDQARWQRLTLPGFDLMNLGPQSTGLPFWVWVMQEFGWKRAPRLMVSREARLARSKMMMVTILPPIHVLRHRSLDEPEMQLLERWIEMNRELLVAYWSDMEMCSVTTANALKPVGPIREEAHSMDFREFAAGLKRISPDDVLDQ